MVAGYVRSELVHLLRDTTLTTVALAIALGWSLFQVAAGVSTLVTTLLTQSAPHGETQAMVFQYQFTQGLTWQVGSHILTVGRLVSGLIDLTIVLGVALLVQRRSPDRPPAS